MGLESATNINTLNENNPLGTDPRSQGDDHIRMIKSVLKSDVFAASVANGSAEKTTPVDADLMLIADSAASYGRKKLTWANLKATIKSYYDSVTATLTNKTISGANNTLSNIGIGSITMNTGKLLGRTTSGTGAVEEISVGTGLTLSGGTLSTASTSAFPAGTKMLFQQTSAPTGWTKDTTHNDKALRVVSGTASSGGSVAFSTVFGKTATDAFTLTVSNIPSHDHQTSQGLTGGSNNISGYVSYPRWSSGFDLAYTSGAVAPQGGGAAHSHGIDIRVQYVDIIIATKD